MGYRLIAWLVAAGLLLAGLGWIYVRGHNKGYAERDLECKVEVAKINDKLIKAEREANSMRERGRILADRLATQEQEFRAQLAAASRRMTDEIDRRARADRVALDSALVRLLNQRTPIVEYVDGQARPAAAQPDAANAGVAGDPARSGGASERAVARWASTVIEMYDTCRGRLHALQAHMRAITE